MAISMNARDCAGVIEKERELLETYENGGTLSGCFTGTGLTASRKFRLKTYFELTDEIVDMGVPIKQVYRNLPKIVLSHGHTTVGLVSIPSLKHHSPIRKKMIDYIFKQCADNKGVDITELIRVSGVDSRTWTEENYREHYKKGSAEHAINAKRSGIKRIKHLQDLISKTVREGDIRLLQQDNTHLLGKIRLLMALSTPLYNHCEKMNEAGYGDNPYAALSHLVKFWNEGHPPAALDTAMLQEGGA